MRKYEKVYRIWSIGEIIQNIAATYASGPLVNLHFFDVSMLQHCTLHILNLTLLGICNGAILLLGQNNWYPFSPPRCWRLLFQRVLRGQSNSLFCITLTAQGNVDPDASLWVYSYRFLWAFWLEDSPFECVGRFYSVEEILPHQFIPKTVQVQAVGPRGIWLFLERQGIQWETDLWMAFVSHGGAQACTTTIHGWWQSVWSLYNSSDSRPHISNIFLVVCDFPPRSKLAQKIRFAQDSGLPLLWIDRASLQKAASRLRHQPPRHWKILEVKLWGATSKLFWKPLKFSNMYNFCSGCHTWHGSYLLFLGSRSDSEADRIFKAGETFLDAYRLLNEISIRSIDLHLITPGFPSAKKQTFQSTLFAWICSCSSIPWRSNRLCWILVPKWHVAWPRMTLGLE